MNIVFWWAFTHQWGRCRACVCYQLADSATDLTPRRPYPLKITTWLSLVDAQAKVHQHWKEKNNHNKTRKFTSRSSITCNLVVKVARYSFSRSIPPKFERKLRRDNLETKRSFKGTVDLKTPKFFKKFIERFKNYSLICWGWPKCLHYC